MVINLIQNNNVNLFGKILSQPQFSHEVYGETFLSFVLEVSRLSKSFDKIPITISERLIPISQLEIGKYIEVYGQFRSYNNYNNAGSKLILTVFAKDISFCPDEKIIKNSNQIFLEGYVCKKPIYRVTPFGREISDILIAVNRAFNKSDYIPCISWGRNARYSENILVGDFVKIWGRIQSRYYQKKTESGEILEKIAYEVSITRLEIHNNEGETAK